MKLICLIMILIGTLACTKTKDFGISELKEKKFEKVVIGIGTIKSIQEKKLSDHFTQVNSVDISIEKNIYATEKNVSSYSADLISDTEMIAHPEPFWTDCMDCRADVNVGERVLVYLGLKDAKWQLVHISKIKAGNLHFWPFKNQKEFEISEDDAIESLQKNIKEKFN